MREWAGLITGISGVVPLPKPNFNPDRMVICLNCFAGNYWPAILIIIGLPLVNPKKKKARGGSGQVPPDKNGVFYIVKEQKAGGSIKKTYSIDLDGIMHRRSQAIEGTRESTDTLMKRGERFVSLTNNVKRTKRQNVEHMEQMGFTGIREEHSFISSMVTARYAVAHHERRNVWCIRQDGLGEALEDNGSTIIEQDVDLVFVGLDNIGIYEKYSKALDSPPKGVKSIGTNNDRLLVQPDGFVVGNGFIVVMFECASGQVSPKIRKPCALILEEASKYFQLNADGAVILGDNLETDIPLGVKNHVGIVLATSGVHQHEDVEKLQIRPTRTIDDLRELFAK